jgi:DNA-binding MarR family transcriptional regulator
MQLTTEALVTSRIATPASRARAHAALDEALLDLRRLWMHPRLLRWFGEQVGADVEIATLRTLRAIEAAGDAALGVGDLGTALAVDASTASRLVEQAVGEGYVERTSCEHDRRRTNLMLTTQGRRLLDRSNEVRADLLGRATAEWPDDELEALAGMLARLQTDLRGLLEHGEWP